MAKNHLEYALQKQVCSYLKVKHKGVLFLSDTVANISLTVPQRMRNKAIQKSDFHCPDLLILEPKGKYNGLMLELKVKSPYKKNGEIFKNEHLENQEDSIKMLKDKGYYSVFVWSFEMAIMTIENYLNLN